jgi:hypothetical protein
VNFISGDSLLPFLCSLALFLLRLLLEKLSGANMAMDIQWLKVSSRIRINVIHSRKEEFLVELHEKLN